MALYRDDNGHLYWHDRIATRLEPVAPTERQAAHGIRPKIARLRPGRTGWLQAGCLGVMGTGLGLALLSMPVASRDWPLALGLAVLGFFVAGFAKIFFIDLLCAERAPFDRPLSLSPVQPWAPGLLGLAMVLSLVGPAYVLCWAPGLGVMDGAGRSFFALIVLAWMIWRQVRQWHRVRGAIRQALTMPLGST